MYVSCSGLEISIEIAHLFDVYKNLSQMDVPKISARVRIRRLYQTKFGRARIGWAHQQMSPRVKIRLLYQHTSTRVRIE